MLSTRLRQKFIQNATRFFAIALAILGIVAFSATPAFAEASDLRNDLNHSISEDSVLRDDDYIIAACAGTIYNGYGTVECQMPYGNMWTSIKAKTGYNGGLFGDVDCYVEFPNGSIYFLGTIGVSNGETPATEFFFCPYGTYNFIFDASTTTSFSVNGYIFE